MNGKQRTIIRIILTMTIKIRQVILFFTIFQENVMNIRANKKGWGEGQQCWQKIWGKMNNISWVD